MALEIEQLIKLIIGIVVVVGAIFFAYTFFKGRVIDFFKGLSINDTTKLFLYFIK